MQQYDNGQAAAKHKDENEENQDVHNITQAIEDFSLLPIPNTTMEEKDNDLKDELQKLRQNIPYSNPFECDPIDANEPINDNQMKEQITSLLDNILHTKKEHPKQEKNMETTQKFIKAEEFEQDHGVSCHDADVYQHQKQYQNVAHNGEDKTT